MLIIILSFYLHVNFLTIRKLCIHDPLVFPFSCHVFSPLFSSLPIYFSYVPHRIFLLQFSLFFSAFSLENCYYFIYTIDTQKAEVFYMTELSIHELSLGFSHDRQMLVEFLAKHHLNYEDDIEAAFGVFDSDDNLTGCGCCAGNLLKCFAVDESLRGQNALGSLVSRLVENRFEAGHYDLFVITRPKNKVLLHPADFTHWQKPKLS